MRREKGSDYRKNTSPNVVKLKSAGSSFTSHCSSLCEFFFSSSLVSIHRLSKKSGIIRVYIHCSIWLMVPGNTMIYMWIVTGFLIFHTFCYKLQILVIFFQKYFYSSAVSRYSFEIHVLKYFLFMLLYTHTPLHFRGKYYAFNSVTFIWKIYLLVYLHMINL